MRRLANWLRDLTGAHELAALVDEVVTLRLAVESLHEQLDLTLADTPRADQLDQTNALLGDVLNGMSRA